MGMHPEDRPMIADVGIAFLTPWATPASEVAFHGDPIPHGELLDALTQRDDHP